MDRLLEKLLRVVDREVGLASTLVVLTSDHGVSPVAEVNAARKMPGGRLLLTVVSDTVQAALSQRYGPGNWVAGCWDLLVYLNGQLIAEKKLEPAEVRRTATAALLEMPHIARAYARDELLDGGTVLDETGRLMKNSYNAAQGADIEFLPEPYWVFTDEKTTHGTTYTYDTHVPLILMGTGIRAGSYAGAVRSNDVAPTVAAILRIQSPSGSVGRVLKEGFAQ
jgi:arylsulfatase A-like enzyme